MTIGLAKGRTKPAEHALAQAKVSLGMPECSSFGQRKKSEILVDSEDGGHPHSLETDDRLAATAAPKSGAPSGPQMDHGHGRQPFSHPRKHPRATRCNGTRSSGSPRSAGSGKVTIAGGARTSAGRARCCCGSRPEAGCGSGGTGDPGGAAGWYPSRGEGIPI